MPCLSFLIADVESVACYNMRPALEFSAKHNIKPHLTTYKLEELPKMIDLMTNHKAQGRMGVVFD
jgi:D-arabinose 1-dehydrogenase-like Zn-dependent alcohol dehydrogenase